MLPGWLPEDILPVTSPCSRRPPPDCARSHRRTHHSPKTGRRWQSLPVYRPFAKESARSGDGTSPPVGMRDPRISPKSDFGLTFFLGVDGRAIARDIFLDGNTWHDSHNVDKKNFVADISFGMSVVYRTVKVTYTHVYRTEEFIGQDDGQVFGSLMVAVTF